MEKIIQLILAAILICGATMVLISCSSKVDNPAPPSPTTPTSQTTPTSPTLPKSYNLVADEYKEAILDETIWDNIANIPQDQGETFTIESPKPGAQLTIHYYRPDNAGQDETPVERRRWFDHPYGAVEQGQGQRAYKRRGTYLSDARLSHRWS